MTEALIGLAVVIFRELILSSCLLKVLRRL